MSKVAVVFWSATGNTETMANCVAEGANGTIVPASGCATGSSVHKVMAHRCSTVRV